MQRRQFLSHISATFALSTGVFAAGRARASTYGDEVAAQLKKQGFSKIVKESTWLGRERILAERKDGEREIILNPRTGEILRDTWITRNGAAASRPIVDDVGDGTSGSGSGSDDNSGSGSGSGDDSGNDSGDDSGDDSGGSSGGSGGNSGSGGSGGGGNSGGGNGDGKDGGKGKED